MRRIRVGVAALGLSLALGQNAPAADLPAQPVYKAPVAVLMHNWTGFYVGGHLGGAWSRVRWGDIVDNNAFAFTGASVTQQPSGWIGGGHVGYLHQFGNLVAGIEFAWSATGLKKTELDVDVPASGTGDSFESRVRDIFALTGRLGHAWNRVLVYVKGGYANGNIGITAIDTVSPALRFTANARQSGWTGGAGIDYALTQNLILGAEYNYFSFGSHRFSGTLPVILTPFAADVSARVHAVTARISWQFR